MLDSYIREFNANISALFEQLDAEFEGAKLSDLFDGHKSS